MRRLNYQLELFSEDKHQLDKSSWNSVKVNIFSGFYKHEKLILTIIIFLISIFISFCIGIEKGKTLVKNSSLQKPLVRPDSLSDAYQLQGQQKINQEVQIQKIETQKGLNFKNPKEKLKPLPKADKNIYTVQLASYKFKKYAEKEAEILRKKGIQDIIIINKDEYVVLCAGNFEDKEKAKLLWKRFRSNGRYPDCFIRRL